MAKEDFAAIRTGRAHPAMFAKITADYYGTHDAGAAAGVVPGARGADGPHHAVRQGRLGAIEKAIRDSDLGVNPTSDGTVIRVVFPQLTEERRKEYVKVAKHKAEEARVSIRNVRRHAKEELDRIGKDGEAGEDDVRRAEKELEDVTHRYVAAGRRAAQAQGSRAPRGLRPPP